VTERADRLEPEEWLPRTLALLVIGAAVGAFLIHALVGFRGAYLTYGSGVWLSLARDLSEHGVLFRDLSSDLGYGGTRYFPLFFVTISGFLKLGFPPAISGWLAGSIALVVLVTGAHQVARVAGAPRLTAWVAAAAAAGPYFAIEAVFGVRADVMAAGLNLWGVGLLLPAWQNGVQGRSTTWLACVCFALAFATKVTALAIPAAMIAAALATGRVRVGARLGGALAGAVTAILLLAQLASGGRAFRVWASAMFAGTDSSGTLSAFLDAGFLPGLLNSHLVVAAFSASLIALGLSLFPVDRAARRAVSSRVVALALWVGATAVLGVTLSSPGTVPANQVIEWLAISMLTPVIVAGPRLRFQRVTGVAIAVMASWMAIQNVSRAAEMRSLATADSVRQRQEFVERIRAFDAPILSESALWPVLAAREVVVPDPFAARLVFRSNPELERKLVDEIARRKYTRIILEFDPTSPEGRGMYEFAHFGRPVIAAIEAHYVLDVAALPNAFVFAPRSSGPTVDLPRRY
jgi:hypothetical protein